MKVYVLDRMHPGGVELLAVLDGSVPPKNRVA
jgi:hypothetical protein